jgi:uncharacterized protein
VNRQTVTIPSEGEGMVSGVLSIPETYPATGGTGAIFAHGAANDMNNPLIVEIANGLCHAGYPTLRFNFLYREKGQDSIDSLETLERTWFSALSFFKNSSEHRLDEVIAVGKSLGGRIASQMIAEGKLPANRLIFLGYPLHPPGKKEKLRDEHLYHIGIPMLFFAGTRDPFADLSLLQGVVDKIEGDRTLEVIEDGDHSFDLPETSKTPQGMVYDRILQKTLQWLER